MMNLKVSKPVKLQSGNKTVLVRPHQSIRVPDILGQKLLEQASDRIKKIKR